MLKKNRTKLKTKHLIRILILIIVVISIILNSFCSYFYTTKPSLHYLGIFYFSVGIIILGIIQFLLLITKQSSYKRQLNYLMFGSPVMISLPILIDGNVSNVARIIGFLFCLVSILCLTYLFVKILLEKNPIVYNKN